MMSQHEREQIQAQSLDTYLNGLLAGCPERQPQGLKEEQVTMAQTLVTLGDSIQPDARFARQLEARLYGAARARAKATAQTPAPGLLGRLGATHGKARFAYALAATAALALLVFAAWVWYQQSRQPSDPGQVAQQPTSTLVQPTSTALPPTTQATVTSLPTETVWSTPTPTPTRIPPTATRAVPTATASPTPGQPIPLPALAKWQEGGYGGGGMGGPIATTRTFVLGIELPLGPEQMIVYVQRELEKLSAAYAGQMAERLGLQGEVYQSIRLASVPDPEEEPFRGYLAVDGARQVMFEATGIVRYTDRNRTPYVEGYWHEPGAMPPLAEAAQTAEAFLRAAGLLEGEYQMAAGGDVLAFHRVLDGQWSMVEPFVRVAIWSDGQIGQVVYLAQTLDILAEYPIISAQEAWTILSAGQSDERVWQNPYRSPETVPWGEWRHQNPTFWARSYRPGQQAHRFGVPQTWFPIEAGGTPYVTIGDLVLTGDVQPLVEYALQQYTREQWNYVHVWGEVQDAGDYQTLAVEGWEPAEETYWIGILRRQNGQDMLVLDDGRTIQLHDLPADLADGTHVAALGGQVDDRLEWHIIQEMNDAEPPSQTRIANVQMTVEQVDLVYLSLAPNVIPPERFADPGYRAVQPVWRFRGHDDQGAAFEVYVQAIRDVNLEQ